MLIKLQQSYVTTKTKTVERLYYKQGDQWKWSDSDTRQQANMLLFALRKQGHTQCFVTTHTFK